MPTVNDATVVASAYDTSGNGGRRLARFSDGTLISASQTMDSNATVYLHKSTDNGATWTLFIADTNAGALGNKVTITIAKDILYVLVAFSTNTISLYAYTKDGTKLVNNQPVDSAQSALGAVSMATNEAGTELHATWSSKNATYSSSFNIRYAKGTINTDGSVTWGAVVQVTTANTAGVDLKNPSIVIKGNGYPFIAAEQTQTNFMYITGYNFNGTTWTPVSGGVYSGGSYTQSSPSAIFVPQSVNGLANGRIWVAWHGKNASVSADSIFVSYSDDGGITWSTPVNPKIRSAIDPTKKVSLTANKSNEIFILETTANFDGFRDITRHKFTTTWSSLVLKNMVPSDSEASSLYDPSFGFSSPLFIYRDTAKVGFYGTWTVTTISVQQGSIGAKTDKSNLLTYTITTDGTMSTITEKVNGVTVGTKTATSGSSQIAGLTQAQWDAVRYGKYKDATGGSNTLEITMGSEKWTYTFDKRLATDADVLSAVKATQDAQQVTLPAVKAKLASVITSKGVAVMGSDSWDALETAVKSMVVKKSMKGQINSQNIGSGSVIDLSITDLGFTPKYVIISPLGEYEGATYFEGTFKSPNVTFRSIIQNVATGTFTVRFSNIGPVSKSTGVVDWFASE